MPFIGLLLARELGNPRCAHAAIVPPRLVRTDLREV